MNERQDERPNGACNMRSCWNAVRAPGACLLGGALLGAVPAMAQLPTLAPPTRGTSTGNYLRTWQDYAFDFFVVIGLLIATVALIAVAKNTIGAYFEVQDGKGTWAQVGMNAGIGALLVVFVSFLLTDAAGIL